MPRACLYDKPPRLSSRAEMPRGASRPTAPCGARIASSWWKRMSSRITSWCPARPHLLLRPRRGRGNPSRDQGTRPSVPSSRMTCGSIRTAAAGSKTRGRALQTDTEDRRDIALASRIVSLCSGRSVAAPEHNEGPIVLPGADPGDEPADAVLRTPVLEPGDRLAGGGAGPFVDRVPDEAGAHPSETIAATPPGHQSRASPGDPATTAHARLLSIEPSSLRTELSRQVSDSSSCCCRSIVRRNSTSLAWSRIRASRRGDRVEVVGARVRPEGVAGRSFRIGSRRILVIPKTIMEARDGFLD